MTRKKTTDYFCISEKRSQKTWRKSSKERDSSRISQRDNPREGGKKKERKQKETSNTRDPILESSIKENLSIEIP